MNMLNDFFNRLLTLLKKIGPLRDPILVAVSLLYISGYVVWSFVALFQNLGSLPAVDSQYFVAGAPVLLALLACLLIVRVFHSTVTTAWPRWIACLSPCLRSVFLVVLLVVTIASCAVFLICINRPESKLWGLLADLVFLVGVALLLHAPLVPQLRRFLPFLFRDEKISAQMVTLFGKPINVYRGLVLWSLHFIIILAFSALLGFYAKELYLKIPQALGGAKPRIARLDLAAKDLSAQTLVELNIETGSNPVRRTAALPVFFLGSSTILVDLPPSTNQNGKARIELARTCVKAIHWIDSAKVVGQNDAGAAKDTEQASEGDRLKPTP